MSGQMQTPVDRPYAQQPETVAAARRVISQEDDAEFLLVILGLAPDPVAQERQAAKARAMLGGRTLQEQELPAGYDCGICGNRLPAHGVCRRKAACREAARERGVSA